MEAPVVIALVVGVFWQVYQLKGAFASTARRFIIGK